MRCRSRGAGPSKDKCGRDGGSVRWADHQALPPGFRIKRPADRDGRREQGAVQGKIFYFGTYRDDEAGKKIAFRIEASSLPHFDATSQTWDITAVTKEALTCNTLTPSTAGYVRGEVTWKKAK